MYTKVEGAEYNTQRKEVKKVDSNHAFSDYDLPLADDTIVESLSSYGNLPYPECRHCQARHFCQKIKHYRQEAALHNRSYGHHGCCQNCG